MIADVMQVIPSRRGGGAIDGHGES